MSQIARKAPSQKEKLLRELTRADGKSRLICILDACRYNEFEKYNYLPGRLEKVISTGSTTWEWAKETFTGFYPNVVYISATAYIAAKVVVEAQKRFTALDHFPVINDVWDWGYDEQAGVTFPEIVAGAVWSARKEYPGRLVIAHFMQPHCPYIGSPPLGIEQWENIIGETSEYDGQKVFPPMRTIIEKGYGDLLLEAYRGNIIRVLKVVGELMDGWSKVIITSDHGEGFGENGIYGHSEGIRTPELLEVPWFTS